MPKDTLYARAIVTSVTADNADITFDTQSPTACENCHRRGGCQSLSLYRWLFAARRITSLQQPSDAPYQINEQLTVTVSITQLQNALVFLLGSPLLGFIIGLLLFAFLGELASFVTALLIASASFFIAQRYVMTKIVSAIAIVRKADTP